MARRTKPDPNKVYVAIDSFSTDVDGVPETIPQGTRLQGDNPLVANHADLFALEDRPEEIERRRRDLYAEAARVGNESRLAASAPAARVLTDRLRAKRNLKLEVDGELRAVKKGELLEPGDMLAALVPSAFDLVGVEA